MTDAEMEVCVAWVRAHAHKWQVLNRSQWNYQFRSKTLVRFVEEAQMRESEVRLLLEYLSSDACIATLSLYDQAVSDDWKPIRAWFEISNRAVGSVHGVRLYHGLRTDPDDTGEDGPYVVEDGCAYRVSLSYYWNQPSVREVPKSTSGVSYRIGSLSRDTDTGLFTYSIEKRERVRQDVAEYLTARTAFAEHTEEYHLGVRADDVEKTGKQADVDSGKVVRRKISKNADCTSDVHNETTVEKPVVEAVRSVHVGLTGTVERTVNRSQSTPAPTEGLKVGESVENARTEGGLWNQTITKLVRNAVSRLAESCRTTIFGHTHSTSSVQSEDPGFEHVEEASGGVVTEKSVSLTSDGAYRVDDRTTVEKPVVEAVRSVHVGLTGTVERTVNRSQSTPAPTEGLKVGESVENARTEGGLWNQTITKLVRNAVSRLAESCRTTIFSHTHSTSSVQSENPGTVNAASGNGIVSEKSVSLTSDGAYRVDDRTTVEKPVAESVKMTRKTLAGTRTRTVNRNQSTPAPTEGLKVGESVENARTEGGLWNTTTDKIDGGEGGEIRNGSSEDKFSSSKSTVSLNDASGYSGDAVGFSEGSIKRKTNAKNEDGTVSEFQDETTAKSWSERHQWMDSEFFHIDFHYRNMKTIQDPPTGYDRTSSTWTMNQFGLYDGSWSVVRYRVTGGNGRYVAGHSSSGGSERTESLSESYTETAHAYMRGTVTRKVTVSCEMGYTTVGKYLSHRKTANKAGMTLDLGSRTFDDTFTITGKDYDGDGVLRVFCLWKIYTGVSYEEWKG